MIKSRLKKYPWLAQGHLRTKGSYRDPNPKWSNSITQGVHCTHPYGIQLQIGLWIGRALGCVDIPQTVNDFWHILDNIFISHLYLRWWVQVEAQGFSKCSKRSSPSGASHISPSPFLHSVAWNINVMATMVMLQSWNNLEDASHTKDGGA